MSNIWDMGEDDTARIFSILMHDIFLFVFLFCFVVVLTLYSGNQCSTIDVSFGPGLSGCNSVASTWVSRSTPSLAATGLTALSGWLLLASLALLCFSACASEWRLCRRSIKKILQIIQKHLLHYPSPDLGSSCFYI